MVELPDGYVLRSIKAEKVSDRDKMAWERLMGRKWSPPYDAQVFFVEFNGVIVASEYAVARNGIGTFHSGMVHEQHRRKGFYRIMSLHGLQYLMTQGITVFEIDTNYKILGHFWRSIGFKQVSEVAPHAHAGFFKHSGS